MIATHRFSFAITLLALLSLSALAEDTGTIRSIRNVQKVLRKKSTTPTKFDLQGRLIFKNAGWAVFRIQDGNDTVHCEYRERLQSPDFSAASLGDLIRISGTTNKGFKLSVDEFQLIEEGDESDITMHPSLAAGRKAHWKYVPLKGVVREVHLRSEFQLIVWDGHQEVAIQMPLPQPGTQATEFIGREIYARGLMGLTHDGYRLMLMSSEQIEFTDAYQESELHKVSGPIDHVGGDCIYIGGYKLQTSFADRFATSTIIDALFRPDPVKEHTGRLTLSKNVRLGEKQDPITRSARWIVEGDLNYHRVTTTGIVRSCQQRRGLCTVHVADGGMQYNIRMPACTEAQLESLLPGCQIQATGVVELHYGKPERDYFDLHAGSAEDIIVVAVPLQVYVSQIAVACGGLFLGCILIAIWQRTLQHKVNVKTEELRELTARTTATTRAVRDGVLVFDQDARVSQWNEHAESILGQQFSTHLNVDTVGSAIANSLVMPNEFLEFWSSAFSEDTSVASKEFKRESPDGWLSVYTAPVLDVDEEPVGRIWTFDDITLKKQLEEDFLQSRKINAVGRLAGGVAHDFNNLLQVISAHLTVCDTDGISRSEQNDSIHAALGAVDRAAQLTSQLLTFSRRTPMRNVVVNVNEIVTQVRLLMGRTIGTHIDVSMSLEPELWPTEIDPAQFEQVLVNLCLNGRDAIGDQFGSLKISTRNESDPMYGDNIRIAIEDSGCGMSGDVRERIFEPFFTTKEINKGTGLGLSMAHGVVAQSGGRILCESTVDRGTRFDIYLPRSAKSIKHLPADVERGAQETPEIRRVLIVDDDPAVLRSGELLLQKLNQQVQTASGGHEAIELLTEHKFDLVILDLTMPQMSGRETLERIKEILPAMKVIVCSGYSEDIQRIFESERVRPDGILAKPFNLRQLSEMLSSRALSSSSDAANGCAK